MSFEDNSTPPYTANLQISLIPPEGRTLDQWAQELAHNSTFKLKQAAARFDDQTVHVLSSRGALDGDVITWMLSEHHRSFYQLQLGTQSQVDELVLVHALAAGWKWIPVEPARNFLKLTASAVEVLPHHLSARLPTLAVPDRAGPPDSAMYAITQPGDADVRILVSFFMLSGTIKHVEDREFLSFVSRFDGEADTWTQLDPSSHWVRPFVETVNTSDGIRGFMRHCVIFRKDPYRVYLCSYSVAIDEKPYLDLHRRVSDDLFNSITLLNPAPVTTAPSTQK